MNEIYWFDPRERKPDLPEQNYCSVEVIALTNLHSTAVGMQYCRSIIRNKRVERWYRNGKVFTGEVIAWRNLPQKPNEIEVRNGIFVPQDIPMIDMEDLTDLELLKNHCIYSDDFEELPKERQKEIYQYCRMNAVHKGCSKSLVQIRYAVSRIYFKEMETDYEQG